MSKDAWNPSQYDKFKEERTQPFLDLMSFIQKNKMSQIVDLGCGTGELTVELHKKFKADKTTGIDSSDEMLAQAKSLLLRGLQFEKGNIETWSSPVDLVFSNAAIQWCPDHPEIFRRLKCSLKPGGQLAIQMPMNHDYPTHVLAQEMSREEPWSKLLGSEGYEKQKYMLSPEDYASLMFRLGFRRQEVNLRVYGHKLESREQVIEWVKGSLLTYFKSRFSDVDYQKFTSEFRRRLFEILPDDKPFFYPFKRIFIWGRI